MAKIETNVVKPEVSFFENESTNILLSTEDEVRLDSSIKSIEDFMNNNTGEGKSEQEKDGLYKNAQLMWKDYTNILRDVKYNFHLNRPQWKFLTELILTKLEYDVNTVFFAIELTNLLASMKDTKFTNDDQLLAFPVDATEITYIYHLISKHKVKGLTKDSYTFVNILKRIGDISKVFNYYDTAAKNMSGEIQNWVAAFEEGVSIEEERTVETVQGEVL
jgi:uncharacterized protein YjaG (DUF416 family)